MYWLKCACPLMMTEAIWTWKTEGCVWQERKLWKKKRMKKALTCFFVGNSNIDDNTRHSIATGFHSNAANTLSRCLAAGFWSETHNHVKVKTHTSKPLAKKIFWQNLEDANFYQHKKVINKFDTIRHPIDSRVQK